MGQPNVLSDWLKSAPGLVRGGASSDSAVDLANAAYREYSGRTMTRTEFAHELKRAGYVPECVRDADASPMPPYKWWWVLRLPEPAPERRPTIL